MTARITPPADPSPWVQLAHLGPTALITACLFCAGILALGPGLLALLRLINRLPEMPALIARLTEEDEPRPDGPA